MGMLDKMKEMAETKFSEENLAKLKVSAQETMQNVSEAAKNTGQRISETASTIGESIAETVSNTAQTISDAATTSAQVVAEKASAVYDAAGDKLEEIHATEGYQKTMAAAQKAGQATAEAAQKAGQVTMKGAKIVSGVQAVQDRKEAKSIRQQADEIKKEIEEKTEAIRDDLNKTLAEFGEMRVHALKNTVGNFLECLKQLNQKAKVKEYDFLTEIDLTPVQVKELETIDMNASQAIKTLAVGGSFAAVGVAATPAIVTSAVTALATASTGTAISSLSGAAATNAVLAWLGGGSIAAGGGGVAAGTVVLGTITGGVAVGAAVISMGILASSFYSRKLTEATEYLAQVKEWEEKAKQNWVVLEALKTRTLEMQQVTADLEKRAAKELEKLKSLIPFFNKDDKKHVSTFQKCALLVKSMSELAQVPLLDEDGNMTESSGIMAAKTKQLLNTDL